ncbi:DNA-directed RNA polymerase [Scheffersomyces spartinae]|uniref:DNA-directed RNA polymerase n=1 Tax=Scheffersomyces spartinae TaxID=45513 RepID=A0A9P7VD45_9ASCO|nr:DNA-directed RNA polymerase [Scheffersomyces spartinae]KAG7195756.1 DNA-directed RNA polymerase [Scheffersomyces spartinae]
MLKGAIRRQRIRACLSGFHGPNVRAAVYRSKRYSATAATSTSTSTTHSGPGATTLFGGGSSLFQYPLIEELKSRNLAESKSSIHEKSFDQIDPSTDIPSGSSTNLGWSSSYDPVVRSPFAKDELHLNSLLEAMLTSKNFNRAQNVLHTLYSLLMSPDTFVYSLNRYLEAWGAEETVSLEDMEGLLKDMNKRYPSLRRNNRTYAILLAKAIDEHVHMDLIRALPRKTVRDMLTYVDVIGGDGLNTLFSTQEFTQDYVPDELMELFHLVRRETVTDEDLHSPSASSIVSASASASASPLSSPLSSSPLSSSPSSASLSSSITSSKETIPTLDKDSEDLLSVDSFGMQAIRSTLLGLQAESSESAKLMELIEELKSEPDSIIDHLLVQKRDYFAIYRSLKTPEQKKKFNELLELHNRERERELEIRGVDAAREKWKHEYEELIKRGAMQVSRNLNPLLYQWYSALLPYVVEEQRLCIDLVNGDVNYDELTAEEATQMKKRAHYAPYFVLIKPENLSVITILELLRLNSVGGIADGMRSTRAMVSVGKALELDYKAQELCKTERKKYSKLTKNQQDWKRYLGTRKDSEKKDSIVDNEWGSVVYSKLGGILLALLLHVAKVPVSYKDEATGEKHSMELPAINLTYQYLSGQKVGVLRFHKSLVRMMGGNEIANSVLPQLLPMLVEPRPWTAFNDGGYLYTPNQVIRIKDSPETFAYLKAASDRKNLDLVYDGLNVLGSTAWTVNKRVFEVIGHYWNTGEEFIDIPPIVEEPQMPPSIPHNAEPMEKFEYQKQVRKILNETAALKSQRCDINYKLEIARGFLGEKMYFPHNLDFRGRAYPISPHFNHLGNDLTRSLFLFWEGKELGVEGLRWVKIHLSNVFGIDKVSLDEREAFINKNLDHVFASARDPLNYDWWKKADKPWQALACCFELEEAYQLEDPTKYNSHIPIHQDGSCNGLQHYAALGGDIEGAKQVNLTPADKPQDVYQYVCNLVQKTVDKDAADGNEIAIFLQDKLTRKVVKQTVMTNVYGVTFVGAVAQIEKQLAQYFNKDEDDKLAQHARYLTGLVFQSIRELFEGAHAIQDWLGEAAKRISKSIRIDYEESTANNSNKPSHMSSVIWTTPLGLPCVQPYRVTKKQMVNTNLQDVAITDPFGAAPVDARKQMAAFPPNYVHSLDATHMLLTAKECGEEKMSFAAVHDSYWTHAVDVNQMGECIRNKFISLHSDNLIRKVKDEFETRYKGFLQVVHIKNESPAAKEVRKVRRALVKELGRALTVADEVYIEKKRQELLNSEKPNEVKAGQELITPVSVIENINIEQDIVSSSFHKGVQVLIPLKFPPIPDKGDFDISLVRDSVYFFS